jgi:hypothetical protein
VPFSSRVKISCKVLSIELLAFFTYQLAEERQAGQMTGLESRVSRLAFNPRRQTRDAQSIVLDLTVRQIGSRRSVIEGE